MGSTNYITNCPNCGAPIKRYGKCDYCGTVINYPMQILTIRPGAKKLVCKQSVRVPRLENEADAAAKYVMNSIQHKMAEALADSIKFVMQKEYDPWRCEEVIIVRGELWVTEPDI